MILVLLSTSLSATHKQVAPQPGSNYVFIFTMNLEDCIPCLNNAYLIADFIIKHQVPKERILFVIKERKKKVEKNYENEISHILESSKMSFIWNDKLYSALQVGKDKSGKVSELVIFDTNSNTFVYKMNSQRLTSEKIFPFLNCK